VAVQCTAFFWLKELGVFHFRTFGKDKGLKPLVLEFIKLGLGKSEMLPKEFLLQIDEKYFYLSKIRFNDRKKILISR
jgi:hypothetical protein